MAERLVAVIWDDAHVAQVDSFTAEECRERQAVTMTTFGLLIRDDDKLVAVAAESCTDATYRGVTFIPRAMVREIVKLSCWPKRAKRAVRVLTAE
jgi:hypothetical protein